MQKYNIPRNFEAGVNFFGYSFKARNLVEGVIIGLIIAIPAYNLLEYLNCPWSLQVTIFLAAPPCALSVIGIQGDPLTVWAYRIFRYRQRKRACFYNPRIKTEKAPMDFTSNAFNLLPKDKLDMLYDKYKSMSDQKLRDQIGELYIERENGMFFQDDNGVVDKPYDYMTSKEKRAYRKEQRKKEKEERRKVNDRNKKKKKSGKEVHKKKEPLRKSKAGSVRKKQGSRKAKQSR